MRNVLFPLIILGGFVSLFAGWAMAAIWDRRRQEKEQAGERETDT